MKRILLIALSILIIAVPASADFIDDFNDHAALWQISTADQKTDTDDIYYLSGKVLISYNDETVTIAGKDPVETLAVACCALDSIDTNESFEIAGRIFETYLHALKSEDNYSYSAFRIYKTEIYVTIQDNITVVNLVR